MSVIVWDGTSLACDNAVTDGHLMQKVEKIWKYGDYVVAGVGTMRDVMAMKDWVFKGCKPENYPEVDKSSCFVVVTPKKGLIRYTNGPYGIAHGFNKCAFGAGRDFAYGAFALGEALGFECTARMAAEAASRYSANCGHGVTEYRIVPVELKVVQ